MYLLIFITLFFPQFNPPEYDSVYKIVKFSNEKKLDVEIELANFNLEIKKGDKLAEAFIKYDANTVSPIFEYTKQGRTGKITFTEEIEGERSFFSAPNKCLLKLSPKIPLNLSLYLGTSAPNIDLSGLKVEKLDLSVTGKSKVRFGEPNPVTCQKLRINTQAGIFRGEYLGNARFERFYFTGGVGFYTLDFRGEFSGKHWVEIAMGVGYLKLILPQDTGIRLKTTGSGPKFIEGLDETESGWWLSPNLDKAQKELVVHVDGSFTIVTVEVK